MYTQLFQTDPATVWDILRAFFNPASADLQAIMAAPNRYMLALVIVFLAGVSDAVGQSVVLFANRVPPRRFFLSLFVNAVFFTVSYAVWVFSIGVISDVVFARPLPWNVLAISVAISYLPLFFGYLGLLPYAGAPIIQLLYTYSLISLVRILSVAFNFPPWQAFLCTVAGFIFILLLRSTVGRPVAWIGKRILNLVAGTQLQSDLSKAYSTSASRGDSDKQ